MKAFVTGSHVYGAPSAASDIDLVIRVCKSDALKLVQQSDKPIDESTIAKYGVSSLMIVRYNKLNLLICTDDKAFDTWRIATLKCEDIIKETGKQMERADSVKIFKQIFETFNVR